MVRSGTVAENRLVRRCPTITASGRCHPPGMARRSPCRIHGSRVATWNIIGRGGQLYAIKVLLSPHGPCSSYLRIVNAEIAERNAEAEEKTGMAASGARSTHVAAGTGKNAPLPKGPINSSLRALRSAPRSLRLVRRTF